MARHEAPASVATFDQAVSDYVTGRAKELVRQFDTWQSVSPIHRSKGDPAWVDWDEWVGAAAEILRELTRDA